MKEFRIAHIVPVSHLSDTVNNQYHMCLAHLVECDEYRRHFRQMAERGRFVLMDNGAAEGSQLQPEKLIEMYEKINPTEIVLPDTLYEAGSTIQKSRNFLNLLQSKGLADKYRVMAVPQGKTLEEWEACARIFVKDTRVNSIGVSKFLNIGLNDRYVRVKACNILEKLFKEYKRDDLEVHLLGCDEGPMIVKMIHEQHDFVRGCDSAFSYLQAQAGKLMSLEDDSRPEGTINFIDGKKQKDFTVYMNNFNSFAGVLDNTVSDTWN